MAGPPTAAFGQLNFIFGGAALPYGAAVTMGIQWPTDPPATFLTDLGAVMEPIVQGTLSTDHTLVQIDLKRGPVATGPTYSLPYGEVGLQGTNAAPPAVAGLIHKRVADLTQRLGGRFYWPMGVDESVIDAGVLNPATRAVWQGHFQDLYEFLVAEGAEPQVFPYNSSDPRTVSVFDVDARVATQRRRQRR